MSDFDYHLQPGIGLVWVLRVTGYSDEVDGQVDADTRQLSDVEFEIESMVVERLPRCGHRLPPWPARAAAVCRSTWRPRPTHRRHSTRCKRSRNRSAIQSWRPVTRPSIRRRDC
jgi:hypothetical protein